MRLVLLALVLFASAFAAGASNLDLTDVQTEISKWQDRFSNMDRPQAPDLRRRLDSTDEASGADTANTSQTIAMVTTNNPTPDGLQPNTPLDAISDFPTPPVAMFDGFAPQGSVEVCGGTTVSNAPRTDSNRLILNYKPFVQVTDEIKILVNPALGSCLSSGFGFRGGRPHRGVDYYARPAVMIHAGGSGIIREAGYRDDYGNYVIIDHGDDVFTRYAHLAYLDTDIATGKAVLLGQPLGLMGNTSKFNVAVHLHYELLLGDYDTPKKSFGLRATSLFDYPFAD